MVSGSLDNSLATWNLKHNDLDEIEFESIFVKDWMQSSILCMGFSFNGSILGTGKKITHSGCVDGTLIMWDAHAPSLGLFELLRVNSHSQAIRTLVFSKTKTEFLTGGDDARVMVRRKVILALGFL